MPPLPAKAFIHTVLNNCAQTAQRLIWMVPELELFLYSMNQLFKNFEVTIMSTEPTRELPDTLNGIKLRAIGWEEIQSYYMAVLSKPWGKCLCFMPAGIIDHQENLAPLSGSAGQPLEEGLKRIGIESFGLLGYQAAIARPDSTKEGYTLTGGCVKYYRVDIFRRHPHDTP
jgi:hypothetical protein